MPTILNSWKEISAYLGRGVRTIQRWERYNGLPIRRIGTGVRAPVYALSDEIDQWLRKHQAAIEKIRVTAGPNTKKLIDRTRRMVSALEGRGVDLLFFDLDIAFTMAHSALNAGSNQEKRTRNRKSARRAYDAVLHLSKRLKASAEKRIQLNERLETLKRTLAELGEHF